MVPLLKLALPREILVFLPVMVEEPSDVVLRPRLMEEFPMASLVLPLFMVVLPKVKAVFPSVKLVLPIGEQLVVLTQVWRRGSGLTRREASHAHAAPVVVVTCDAECRARIARPSDHIMPPLSRSTWAVEGHIPPVCGVNGQRQP